jgi:hypothetical protein
MGESLGDWLCQHPRINLLRSLGLREDARKRSVIRDC